MREHRGEGVLKLIVIAEGCNRESAPLTLLRKQQDPPKNIRDNKRSVPG